MTKQRECHWHSLCFVCCIGGPPPYGFTQEPEVWEVLAITSYTTFTFAVIESSPVLTAMLSALSSAGISFASERSMLS